MKKLIKHAYLLGFALTVIASHPALASSKYSEICVRFLTELEYRPYELKIDNAIEKRTALLRSGQIEDAWLLDRHGNKTRYLLDSLRTELAVPVLDGTKRIAMRAAESFAAEYLSAIREQVKARYEKQREDQRQRKDAPKGQSAKNVAFDAAGLPVGVELIDKNRDLALLIARSSKAQLGAADLETLLAQALIEGVRIKLPVADFESKGLQTIYEKLVEQGTMIDRKEHHSKKGQNEIDLVIHGIRATILDEIRAIADQRIEAAEDMIAASMMKSAPDWMTVIHGAAPVLESLKLKLEQIVPMSSFSKGAQEKLRHPLLMATSDSVQEHVEEISKRWVAAIREEVHLEYDALERKGGAEAAVTADALGLPMRPRIVENYDFASLVVRVLGKFSKKKLSLNELEQSVVAGMIEGIKFKIPRAEFEAWGGMALLHRIHEKVEPIPFEVMFVIDECTMKSNEPGIDVTIKGLKHRTQYRLSQVVDHEMARQGWAPTDWDSVVKASQPELAMFVQILKTQFALTRSIENNSSLALKADGATRESVSGVLTGVKSLGSGRYQMTLQDPPIAVDYIPELATSMLHSSNGMIPNPTGPMLFAWHGAGTTLSNAASWKYLISKFTEVGYNALAPSLPKAGSGLDVGGLMPTLAYVEKTVQWVRSKYPTKPLIVFGRSMGSSYAFAHELIYDREENSVDAIIATSLSNPFTISKQSELVWDQVRAGTIKNVVQDSLNNAVQINDRLAKLLVRIQSTDPSALSLFGDRIFAIQGEADRDGGPGVVDDLLKMRDGFAPLMHVYVIEDPLAKYKIDGIEKLPEDGLEAGHIVLTNRSNMDSKVAEKLFPGVDPIDYPKAEDQNKEVFASTFAFYDYLADSKAITKPMHRAREVFRRFRSEWCGFDQDGRPITFFQKYLKIIGVTPEKLAAAVPGRRSITERMKRVESYWQHETARVNEIYRARGLLKP